jgi:TRAP transporter TAXI family solute receptor
MFKPKEDTMRKIFVLGLALIFGFCILAGLGHFDGKAVAAGKTTFVTIGTGGITGVYYPTGGAIAKMVNKKRKEYGIRATVESTGGSVFNINAIMAGDLEFGVAQSDRQYQAVMGIEDWKDKGPQKDLRAVFSIHPENVDLLAAEDAGINSIQDLKGKRVNIGNVGSGYRQNAIDALEANGLDYEKDFNAESLKAAEAPGLIQDGRLDAAFYTVGHPSGYYKEATSGKRKVKFIPITNIESLLKKYPYYAKSVTRVEDYPGAANDKDIPTFGVKATFVTSAKVPDEVVYAITKEVFDNFDEFVKLHPAYAGLTKESMLEGLSAPIHPGAMKYYKEVGMMK